MIYREQTTINGVEIVIGVFEDGRTASFSKDPTNPDYIAYLAWLAEGNEPLPADEETK